jgi:hypothetical protein
MRNTYLCSAVALVLLLPVGQAGAQGVDDLAKRKVREAAERRPWAKLEGLIGLEGLLDLEGLTDVGNLAKRKVRDAVERALRSELSGLTDVGDLAKQKVEDAVGRVLQDRLDEFTDMANQSRHDVQEAVERALHGELQGLADVSDLAKTKVKEAVERALQGELARLAGESKNEESKRLELVKLTPDAVERFAKALAVETADWKRSGSEFWVASMKYDGCRFEVGIEDWVEDPTEEVGDEALQKQTYETCGDDPRNIRIAAAALEAGMTLEQYRGTERRVLRAVYETGMCPKARDQSRLSLGGASPSPDEIEALRPRCIGLATLLDARAAALEEAERTAASAIDSMYREHQLVVTEQGRRLTALLRDSTWRDLSPEEMFERFNDVSLDVATEARDSSSDTAGSFGPPSKKPPAPEENDLPTPLPLAIADPDSSGQLLAARIYARADSSLQALGTDTAGSRGSIRGAPVHGLALSFVAEFIKLSPRELAAAVSYAPDLGKATAATVAALAKGGLATSDLASILVPAARPAARPLILPDEAVGLADEARHVATAGSVNAVELERTLRELGFPLDSALTPGVQIVALLGELVRAAQAHAEHPMAFAPLFLAEMSHLRTPAVDLASGSAPPQEVWFTLLELQLLAAFVTRSAHATRTTGFLFPPEVVRPAAAPVEGSPGQLRPVGLFRTASYPPPRSNAQAKAGEQRAPDCFPHVYRWLDGVPGPGGAPKEFDNPVIKHLIDRYSEPFIETGAETLEDAAEKLFGGALPGKSYGVGPAKDVWSMAMRLYKLKTILTAGMVGLKVNIVDRDNVPVTEVHKDIKGRSTIINFWASVGIDPHKVSKPNTKAETTMQRLGECLKLMGIALPTDGNELAADLEKWQVKWRMYPNPTKHAKIAILDNTGGGRRFATQFGMKPDPNDPSRWVRDSRLGELEMRLGRKDDANAATLPVKVEVFGEKQDAHTGILRTTYVTMVAELRTDDAEEGVQAMVDQVGDAVGAIGGAVVPSGEGDASLASLIAGTGERIATLSANLIQSLATFPGHATLKVIYHDPKPRWRGETKFVFNHSVWHTPVTAVARDVVFEVESATPENSAKPRASQTFRYGVTGGTLSLEMMSVWVPLPKGGRCLLAFTPLTKPLPQSGSFLEVIEGPGGSFYRGLGEAEMASVTSRGCVPFGPFSPLIPWLVTDAEVVRTQGATRSPSPLPVGKTPEGTRTISGRIHHHLGEGATVTFEYDFREEPEAVSR